MFSFWMTLIFLIYLTSFTSSLVIPKPLNLNPRSSTPSSNQDFSKRGKDSKVLNEDEAELARIQKLMDDEIWDKWSYAHMIHGSGSRAVEVMSISTVA